MTERRDGPWIDTRTGLVCLFALGLAVRLVLARYSEGLWFDVTLFRLWTDGLIERGLGNYYAPEHFADSYPPGYLYVLFVLGHAWHALTGGPPPVPVLKLPAIMADLGVAMLAGLLAMRIAPGRSVAGLPIRAVAAAAVLLNPGLILVSAVWGQVDSVLALLILASIATFGSRPNLVREGLGLAVMAIAVVTKPQAVLVLPVIAVVLVHSTPGPWPLILARAAAGTLVATTVAVGMFAPFGIGPTDIPAFYGDIGVVYQLTSLWAFNVWGALGFYQPDVGAEAMRIAGVAAFHVGLIAFAGATIAILAGAWHALGRSTPAHAVMLFGVVAVTCAAFALLTRMHERYLYMAVVALTPLMADRRFRWALAVLSIAYLLNVHFVYVFHSHQASPPGAAWTIQPLYDLLFGQAHDAAARKVLSVMTAASCLGVAFLGWRWLDPIPRRVSPRTANL